MKCDPMVHKDLVPCKNQECTHHFAFNMNFQKRSEENNSFRETEASTRSLNCMCLLEKPLSAIEISEMFGVRREYVWQLENTAKKHLAEKMGD